MRARRRHSLANPAPASAGAALRLALNLFDLVALGLLVTVGPWLVVIILVRFTLPQLAQFAP